MLEYGLKILAKRNLIHGLKLINLSFCEYYVTSKQHRLKFDRSIGQRKHILDSIHSDVWESPEMSLGRAKYFVSFIDDYSRRLWVYPINQEEVGCVSDIQILQSKSRT